MKKLMVLVAAVALSGAVTSCKKDYVCKCTKTHTKADGSSTTEPTGSPMTFKDTKARAIDRCNQQETDGNDLSGSYTTDCEIQ